MKNQTNSSISFLELEAQIDKKLKELRASAMHNISMAAEKGMNPNIVLAQTDADIEDLKALALQWFQPQSNQLKIFLEQRRLENTRVAIQQNLKPVLASLDGLKIEIQRITRNHPQKSYWQAKAVILCAVGLDAIFSYRAMQVVAPNMIASFITTAAAVGVLAGAAHLIGRKMRSSRNRREKLLWFFAGFTGGAIVFMALSIFRQIFFGGGNAVVNVVLWTLTNLFFFTIALLTSAYALPSKEEEEISNQLTGLQKEEEKLLQAKRNEEQTLSQAENEHNSIMQQMGQLKSQEINMMHKLEKHKLSLHAALLLEFELKGGSRNSKADGYNISSPLN